MFVTCSLLLKKHTEFWRLLKMNFLTCYSCSYYSFLVLAKRPTPSKKKSLPSSFNISIFRSTCEGFLWFWLESKMSWLKKQCKSQLTCFIYSKKWFIQFTKINTINVIIEMSLNHITKILYSSKFHKSVILTQQKSTKRQAKNPSSGRMHLQNFHIFSSLTIAS